MTPAIIVLKKAKVKFSVHEYNHDPSHRSYGLEAAEKLGIPPERVFKTLVVSFDQRELAVAIVPVSRQLDLKLVAKALKTKKVAMADKALVEKTTGYLIGGVSPLGQKKRLKTIIDDSAQQFQTINVSAGKRGLEIVLNPHDLHSLTQATFSPISK
jgi:Cys-tRNA(Pro)/Cys-tRNA(Cys) deacylase